MKTGNRLKRGQQSVGQTPTPESAKRASPIVGVGASAGGLEAFTRLLNHLPTDTGLSFVLVQHLDPAHESALPGILARATAMPVSEVRDKLLVEPNRVYVIPPNRRMSLAAGKLRLADRGGNALRSIDYFLESLAREQGEQAIGVILSGTATDGTLGLQAIKAEGGITFAQDESAKYDSMPRSAVAAGCVDFVLTPENIAKELARIAAHPFVAAKSDIPTEAGRNRAMRLAGKGATLPSSGKGTPRSGARQSRAEARPNRGGPGAQADGLQEILRVLRQHAGVDFALYKSSTIQRRVTRRLVLNKQHTFGDYVRFLRGNAKELDALYSDVLISVTSFFRDPEAFEILKHNVFPQLALQRARNEPLRVWVVGCATGQEAYSLAMLYAEFSDSLARAPRLQVFATDLNEGLLEKARAGLYAHTLSHELSPERLRRFFVEEETGYRVCKPLREQVVFARQNLISDPPFSRIDLVSCRNLLIYLEPGLQRRILRAFHYALKPGGFLFLGASEAIGQFAELFEPLDKKHKIYSKKPTPTPAWRLPPAKRGAERQAPRPGGAIVSGPQELAGGMRDELNAQRSADRLLAGKFAPPGVLINAELQILQFRGATAAYLEPPKGKASFDLLKMAREELVLPLRAAVHKARKDNSPVLRENIQLGRDGRTRLVNVEVIPIRNVKERRFLVLFEAAAGEGSVGEALVATAAPPPGKREEKRRLAGLERELAETREHLQFVQEQHEADHEELQASSEETQSANEELQSLNEELETSKEELESSNEELTTLNEEMSNRNAELSRLNADLNNLHMSINTAILVLGRDLTIRRFTPLAQKQFNLLPTDVGRPLSSVRHRLKFPELERFIEESISAVRSREQEVQDEEGHWYSLRVRPYLTLENKIDGAVLVMVDISELKQTEQEIKEARDFAQAIIAEVPPLLVLEPDLRVRSANRAFLKSFGVNAGQTEGRLLYELGNGQWNIPALRQLLEEILPHQRVCTDYKVAHEFEHIGRRSMLLNARQIESRQRILLSIVDITETERAAALAHEAKETLDRHAAELERVVNERTATLRETVRELEAFSYSMVHDMRAPLRAMNTFAHLVHQHYGSRLDEQGRNYLERIFNAAERLDQLIRDVLNYSHTLRDEATLGPVDLDELLRELMATYPEWSSAATEVRVNGRLPVVRGHKALLAQCFSNLVGNALKFVAPGVAPSVRIWAEARGERVRVSIQDNGIGIAPGERQRVFGMFQRIHPASEYEGTGIGLTIVRRAVERMQGQVDFDSQTGRGSTFWFELPTADPEEA